MRKVKTARHMPGRKLYVVVPRDPYPKNRLPAHRLKPSFFSPANVRIDCGSVQPPKRCPQGAALSFEGSQFPAKLRKLMQPAREKLLAALCAAEPSM